MERKYEVCIDNQENVSIIRLAHEEHISPYIQD